MCVIPGKNSYRYQTESVKKTWFIVFCMFWNS